MIKPGRYRAQAKGHRYGKSSSGNEYVEVQFVLLEGPDEGAYITWFGHFSEKTEKRTVDSLLYAGWNGNDFFNLPGLGTKEVSLVLEEDTYEGTTRTRVAWVNSPFGGGLPEDTLGNLGGRLAGLVQHRKQALSRELESAPVLDQPESQFDSPPPGDDDVPF